MSAREPRIRHATVNAAQCITARQLFETIVSAVSAAIDWSDDDNEGGPITGRCETLAQLDVDLCRMLKYPSERRRDTSFILVLDAIDRARDAPPTLLPGLARLSEIVCPQSPPSLS